MSSAGRLLAEYRKARRLSQLELGLQADVSARHISFVETGRAQASREMLLRLAEVLELPYRESNLLLAAAGFAPVFPCRDLEEQAMRPIREALDVILTNHEPYPAMVMDVRWNLLLANTPHQKMLALLMEQAGKPFSSANVLELVFDREGIRPWVCNWDEVAGFLLRRLRRQQLVFPHPETEALYRKLLDMEPPAGWQTLSVDTVEMPIVTLDLQLPGQCLRLFSTLSSFGTALDVSVQELSIENYFPADDETRRFFQALMDV